MKKFDILKNIHHAVLLTLLSVTVFSASVLAGCSAVDDVSSVISGSESGGNSAGSGTDEAGTRETLTSCLKPESPGTLTFGDEHVTVDFSNTSQGYITLNCPTADGTYMAQITAPDGITYNYTLTTGSWAALPLQAGDGSYTVTTLMAVEGGKYAVLASQDISVTLDDEFRPFLYPNQYCNYSDESAVFALSKELSGQSSDDLSYLTLVYHQVIDNVTYDTEKAQNIPEDYIPDPDTTLATNKGICFDYASLMTSLLRSQGIPTKLVVGYSGTVYHAWISVYLKETGWVDKAIEFDGKSWSLMDPTLAAGNNAKDVKNYIGDGSNYTVKYWY